MRASPAHMRNLVIAACTLFATVVTAETNRISVGDLPGTDGRWQAGEAVMDAPPDQVQEWFSDARAWPRRFGDVQWVKDHGEQDGRRVVEFRSRILGRPMTIHLREQRGLIDYTGEGKGVTTQGKLYFRPAERGGTLVILQTTADIHGSLRLIVSDNAKKVRARRKIQSDLAAAMKLARHG
jgi:hypothetical protein